MGLRECNRADQGGPRSRPSWTPKVPPDSLTSLMRTSSATTPQTSGNRRQTLTARSAAAAAFVALIAGGAWLSIPMPLSPVPVVLQNLFVVLAGLALGPVTGTLSVLAYLALGAAGLPLFSGAAGGIGHLLGPTGGYLLGFVPAAMAAGLIGYPGDPELRPQLPRLLLASLAGILMVYPTGLAWLAFRTELRGEALLAAGLLPFIPGDLAKATLAALIARSLHPLPAALRRPRRDG